MSSRITILGSGTCVPSLVRYPCSFLMHTGGKTLLFDAGPGVMRRMLEVGVGIADVSYIFLSHFHPDHSGELASILFGLKYPAPSIQYQPLTIVAGHGFRSFFQQLTDLYENWIVLPPDRFDIIEMDTRGPDGFTTDTFTVATQPVAHRPESVAFRVVDGDGKALVYSGDTDDCDNLVHLAAEADVLICEAAMPDGHKVDGHLTPSLAGRIAQRAGVKRLVLTHFYPPCDQVDIEKQCRSTYSNWFTLATDKMTLTL